MAGALDGIRILDFTQVEAGPICTQVLGDFGADVIKIERPNVGDLVRSGMPDPGPDNAVFQSINRNKRSAEIDLRSQEGRDTIRRLITGTDVVVNNFRPGVMERLGLGYDEVSALNSRIVYAAITGYGPRGPYASKGGQDVLAQAMSGAMARTADPDQPLAIYGTALADYTAGMMLVQGILLALLARERTGRGQRVDVSQIDAMLAMQHQEATEWMMRSIELNWAAHALSGVFKATDGWLVLVGAFKDNPLALICEALGIEDLSAQPQFSTDELRSMNRAELHRRFRDRIAEDTVQNWLQRLEAVDVLCAPVLTLPQVLVHPQVIANEIIWTFADASGGLVTTIGNPVRLSATPASVRRPAPQLGQHTAEILGELTNAASGPAVHESSDHHEVTS